MSRAFVNDDTLAQASETALADRPISPHPNFVTETGRKALEDALHAAKQALNLANKTTDALERKRLSALPLRDIRYYAERLSTAQLVTPPPAPTTVGFGNTVTLHYEDGRKITYQIVGEDEADPTKGLISYVSPLARGLLGKPVGEAIALGPHEIEILTIS